MIATSNLIEKSDKELEERRQEALKIAGKRMAFRLIKTSCRTWRR